MVSVIAPCFSLSASGTVGKALLYYDTKYGARIRTPKRRFTPPGTIWEVNKVWFEKANTRSKSLTREQRLAWQSAYPGMCDSWRDIFMGKQIEAWNLSPSNNLTWPQIVAQPVGDIEWSDGWWDYDNKYRFWMNEWDNKKFRAWTVGSLWWNILDNPRAPTADDPYFFRTYPAYSFEVQAGHTNYFWGGVRYVDGRFKADFLGSLVR